jgi:predicted dehydrogenase
MFLLLCCASPTNQSAEVEPKAPFRLMTVDPGHFHAWLLQKQMIEDVDPTSYVFAPAGPDVQDYLNRVESFNTRAENPTSWNQVVYTEPDFFEQMIQQKPGNVMAVSGNNAKKTEYINEAIKAGIHVLADKPMAINNENFELLQESFELAKQNDVVLYDIMTERHEITIMTQRALSQVPELFGELEKGSIENPAITKESVHHFSKVVAGQQIKRPAWFFDITQQGAGMVDIMTHLVDMIQWECYPDQIIDYKKDIEILRAKSWNTELTPAKFNRVTQLTEYPDFLQKDIINDSILSVNSNGEINYTLKGTHAKTSVIWNYEAPEGGKDTHYSIMRGTKANLIISSREEEDFKATLYVEKVGDTPDEAFAANLEKALSDLSATIPGLTAEPDGERFKINIPDEFKVGHEAHFTQVINKYLNYIKTGKMPDWEVPNMISKYYTTTKAYEMSR